MRVHYLQHVHYEGLGHIANWLEQGRHEVSHTRFYLSEAKLPDQGSFDVLIVLGGPMGVDQESEYPWLVMKKDFILQAIENGKVVLGICLGAQLIASCLGGKVILAPNREIGWYQVMPNHKCNSSSWFHELFASCPTVFHWHRDRFEIPTGGGCNLLSSPSNINQAFCYGKKVLAIQFHLEVTQSDISLMLTNGIADLDETRYVQGKEEILNGMMHMDGNHLLVNKILEKFFEQLI